MKSILGCSKRLYSVRLGERKRDHDGNVSHSLWCWKHLWVLALGQSGTSPKQSWVTTLGGRDKLFREIPTQCGIFLIFYCKIIFKKLWQVILFYSLKNINQALRMEFTVVQLILNCVFFHLIKFGIVSIFSCKIPDHQNCPILVMILRIIITDKINNENCRILKQYNHILYLVLDVFILTFICYLGSSCI